MIFDRLLPSGLLLFIFTLKAHAESSWQITRQENLPTRELWITPGFYSYHFDRELNLENNNYGAGIEYQYTTTQAFLAGRFHNSDRAISNYAALLWQPWSAGPIKLGALAGFIDGYYRANNGGWFPMALPVASIEYGNIGMNLTVIPTIPNTVYGSVTLQLKLQVY